MKNLAGNKECDKFITKELNEAGILIHTSPYASRAEVPSSITGFAGPTGHDFVFYRAWYYWVVKGKVPVEVASVLYSTDLGMKDIRVAGHCGCPPPTDPFITRLDENDVRLFLLSDYDRKYFARYHAGELDPYLAEAAKKTLETTTYCDTQEEVEAKTVTAYVDSYHINSQEGLNLFMNTLREHELA